MGNIVQLVEQRTENPCVPGSSPGVATKCWRGRMIMRRIANPFI